MRLSTLLNHCEQIRKCRIEDNQPSGVLESIAQQSQQILVHLEHIKHDLIETALSGNVIDRSVELLEAVKRANAPLVDLEYGRIAGDDERQTAQLLDEMR